MTDRRIGFRGLLRGVAFGTLVAWWLVLALPAAGQTGDTCELTIDGAPLSGAADSGRAITVPADGSVDLDAVASAAGNVTVALRFGPFAWTVLSDQTLTQTAEGSWEWAGTRDVSEYARFGVGLYQIQGQAGSCSVTGWVRVTGKQPYETPVGLVAGIAAIVGVLVVVGSFLIPARGNRRVVLAAAGGAIAGLGTFVFLQQAGVQEPTPGAAALWTLLPAGASGGLQAVAGVVRSAPPTGAPAHPGGGERAHGAGEAGDDTDGSPSTAASGGSGGGSGTAPAGGGGSPSTVANGGAGPTEATSGDAGPTEATSGDGASVAAADQAPYRAFGLLDCPAEVVAGQSFVVTVGLSPTQAAGVAGAPLVLPALSTTSYPVFVRLAAAGFAFGGEARRQKLEVDGDHPYPTTSVTLIPSPVTKRTERRITAEYSVGGERLGDAIRSVVVVVSDADRTFPAAARGASGVDIQAPSGSRTVDLTVTIRSSDTPGILDWTIDSPHTDVITIPDAPVQRRIGDDAKAFLETVMSAVEADERAGGLVYDDLRGAARLITAKIPAEVFQAIRAISAKVKQPPSILLVSEEAYVPWELAYLETPLVAPPPDAGAPPPPFLSAQARIGRWVQATEPSDGNPRPMPPPSAKIVNSIAVFWGDYSKTDGYENLPHAEAEAKALIAAYGATTVDPKESTISDLLHDRLRDDLLHFAVHGHWSGNTDNEDGIVLTDNSILNALEIEGASLTSTPFVFLNACQVGAGADLLGRYSGIAAAFVDAGASAVIAPIWSIDDKVAFSVAEAFYQAIANGEPPSEILRTSRLGFSPDSTSATTMAYQFFGHPELIVTGLKAVT